MRRLVLPLAATATTYRAIVYSAGVLAEYTAGGAPVYLSGGSLTTDGTGTYLVWDRALKVIRQAAAGETVLHP